MNNVLRPASIDELAVLLRDLHQSRTPAALRGGATHSVTPDDTRIYVALTSLTGVIAYAPEDLTITVRAGTPWDVFQEELRAHNQWLPIEPCASPSSTVAGVAASGIAGPSRFRYGAVRDYLIGMRIVCPGGDIVHSGSNVVKSVAGYDLHKLIAGSRGTLCAIAEATFRVAPRPETQVWIAMPWDDAAHAASEEILRMPSTAVAVVTGKTMTRTLSLEGTTSLLVRLDGFRADVNAAITSLPARAQVWNEMDAQHALIQHTLRSWNHGTADAVRVGASVNNIPIESIFHDCSAEGLLDLACRSIDIDGRNAIPVLDSSIYSAYYLHRLQRVSGSSPTATAAQMLHRRLKETFDPHMILEEWEY